MTISYHKVFRILSLFLVIVFTSVIIYAQEEATAEPTETPELGIEETVTPEIVLPNTSPTLEPIESPTEVSTDAATETTIETQTPSAASIPAEPILSLLVREMFDNAELSAWSAHSDWSLVSSEEGLALELVNSNEALVFNKLSFFNAAAQIRVLINSGSVQLSLRQSNAGNYTVRLNTSGELSLYRAGILLQQTMTSPVTGQWQILRLSVIENVIRVSVNGVELIAFVDDIALPVGQISISASLSEASEVPQNQFLVDDFMVWVPSTELSLFPAPTPYGQMPSNTPPPPLPSATPIVKDMSRYPAPNLGGAEIYSTLLDNNDFAGTAITVPYSVSDDTTDDTLESGEPSSTCGFGMANTVWFSFTPANTSNYSFSSAGSNFDTIMAIYTGTAVNDLTQITCNDDVSATVLSSQFTALLTASTTYYLQIGGFNGRYGNYSLSVQEIGLPVPLAPSLLSPVNGFKTNDTSPDLSWNSVANASQYQIQWATNITFTTNVGTQLVAHPTTSFTLPTLPDTIGTIYYWRVRALNVNSQASLYSAYRAFTLDTQQPLAPTLSLPADLATVSNAEPPLTWLAVARATSYLVELDDDAGFGSPIAADSPVATTSYMPAVSLVQGTYYWRVQARDAAGNISDESSVRSFKVNILTAPLNNAVITANISNQASPILRWALVVGASAYTIQIDDENSFTEPFVQAADLGNVSSWTASPLTTGIYYWRIIPVGFETASPVFNQFTVSPAPLVAPVLLSSANGFKTNDSSPDVSWNPVVNASQYQVQWATNITFTTNMQTQTVADPTTSFTLPTLPDTIGTIYYWRVRSINSLGVAGAYSIYRAFTLDTQQPLAPTLSLPADLATVSNAEPPLTWLAVAGATSYLVELDDDAGFGSPIAADSPVATTSYMPAVSLVQGTYYWRVQARDAAGNISDESSVRSFKVNILTAPLNNAVITANISNQASPILRWALVVGASAYTIEIDDENSFAEPLVQAADLGNVSSWTATPINTGIYYWRIIPVGFETASPIFNQFTVSPAPLVAPVLLSPVNGFKTNDTSPDVSWNLVVNAAQYEVQWATNITFTTNMQTQLVADPTTSLTLPTLPPSAGMIYYWRVRSINSLGVAGAYSIYRAFTLDTQQPLAPTLSLPADLATVSNAKPPLTWLAVAGATSYLVELDDDAGFGSPIAADSPVATTSYMPAVSLVQGTYYWRVQARDAAGNVSDESSIRSFKLNILIAPLNNAVITANISNQASPILRWALVVGASAYTIEIDDENSFAEPLVQAADLGNVSSWTASPLNTGIYYWRIIPVGFEPLTPIFNQFTISPAPLLAPSLLSPANGFKTNDTSPDLSWNPVVNAAQYQVQWATNITFTTNVGTQLVADPTTSLTLPTLPPTAGTIYYWRVRSINSLGVVGAYSAYRYFTLDTNLPNVPTLSLPANNTAVAINPPTFQWLAVIGATRYEIRYGTSLPPNIVVSNLIINSFRPSSPLLLRDYYWQVRAIDAAGNASDWSAVRSVKITSTTTAAPILNRFTNSTPSLSWAPVTWTASGGYYQVQVDNNSTFVSPEYTSGNIPTGTQNVTISALTNGTWYWRVRACTSANVCGAWSVMLTFTIEQ